MYCKRRIIQCTTWIAVIGFAAIHKKFFSNLLFIKIYLFFIFPSFVVKRGMVFYIEQRG